MKKHDHVNKIVEQWQRERPDLDVTPMGIIGRISRLSRHLDQQINPIFEQHGIHIGEFDVLAALRRSGEPYQLTPTALFKAVMLSSGAMTNRLNRLEDAGLITRTADPNDRRGTLVSLTEKGLDVVNAAVSDHVANEWRILATFDEAELESLADLLHKFLLHFESYE